MRKILIIGTLVGVIVLALGAAGLAFAQTAPPPAPTSPGYGSFGSGMMGGRSGFGGMMGGNRTGVEGPLHEYMIAAFAEALGLTPEELETRRDAGETLWQIAESQGISQEQFGTLWTDARTAALEQAVADGVITQEQADWMIQRMAQQQAAGFGPGSGACTGAGPAGGFHRGPGWRWNTQP